MSFTFSGSYIKLLIAGKVCCIQCCLQHKVIILAMFKPVTHLKSKKRLINTDADNNK